MSEIRIRKIKMVTIKAQDLKNVFSIPQEELMIRWPSGRSSFGPLGEPIDGANYILAPLFDRIVMEFVKKCEAGGFPEITDFTTVSHPQFERPTYNAVINGKIVRISFQWVDIDHTDEDEHIMAFSEMWMTGDQGAALILQGLFMYADHKPLDQWKQMIIESWKDEKTYHFKSELVDFYYGKDPKDA